ncbi:MAG: 4-hydroxy-tetrahydrodipicolinate reductase [Candidatus Omnitrophota bacterium]
MVRIVISGICGKMGKIIGTLAAKDKDIEIAGALEARGNAAIGKDAGVTDSLEDIKGAYDVLIEFTSPGATLEHLRAVVADKRAVVIGTTGFSEKEQEEIKSASQKIPVVFSPNMSIGANLLFRLAEDAARALGNDYKAEIVEAHHDQKKDAPSGTAKMLGEVVKKVKGEMPLIHSIRLGDIVGDHTVIFAGKSERVELTHRAHSRDCLARGALAAAKFLAGKKAGLYTMADVIGGRR